MSRKPGAVQFPQKNPCVHPVPEKLFGFSTLDEAKRVQDILLNGPIIQAQMLFAELNMEAHDNVVITPPNPDPPTTKEDKTMWGQRGNCICDAEDLPSRTLLVSDDPEETPDRMQDRINRARKRMSR